MQAEQRSFTSWKMDWINAMMVGLAAREFHVGVCLIQFANQQTRLIFPSQARMASLLGTSERAVRRAIAQMVAEGWIEARRPNRHFGNSYRFIEGKRAEMEEIRRQRDEAFLTDRWGADPAEMTGPDRTEVSSQDDAAQDRSVPSGEDRSDRSDRTDVSSKHPNETPGVEHLNMAGEVKTILRVSDELLRTRAMQPAATDRRRVDPTAQFDRLEQAQKGRA